MPVTNTWGPPSIAGSIDSFVDTALGGIKDYQTGQLLDRLPKTADGSVDYRAAAAAMYRTNPGLAAQFLKMDEHRSLEGYRRDSLRIQQQNADTAADKTGVHDTGDQLIWTDRRGQPLKIYDKETKQFLMPGAGSTQAPQAPQTPQTQQAPRQPPPEAIDILKQRPNTAAQFEKTFGLPPGGAQQYLTGGGTTAAPTAAPAPAPAPAPPPPTRPTSTASPLLQPPPGLSYSQRQEWMKNRIKEQSSVDNAELKKADDIIQSGRTSLAQLAEIIELNKTAFHGPGAELRGNIAALTGIGGKQAGVNTAVLQNKLTSGMLEQLRSTFGGNPTEGENKLLAKVTGSVSQPADVRAEIFKDALHLVRRRIMFAQKYANAQRKGQYMDPNYTDNTPVD